MNDHIVKTNIINLTQHPASREQIAAGVTDLAQKRDLEWLKSTLTFDSKPTKSELEEKAAALADFAKIYRAALIGGAPYLMGPLESALKCKGVTPLYSFSRRMVSENVKTGEKISVFKHIGFVEA